MDQLVAICASSEQAASVSKPISALAALSLVQRGTFDLDTDVNSYLTSWKVPKSDSIPNFLVTLRGLLSHGFPSLTGTGTIANAR